MTPEEFAQKLAQWKTRLDYALSNNVLSELGEKAIEEFRGNFNNSSFFGDAWAYKADGNQSRLVNTGALADSMSATTDSANKSVTITSDLPYSRIHNEGGAITQTVTAKQQRFMGAKWKRSKPVGSTMKIDMPKRQFMGNNVKLTDALKQYLNEKIKPILQ